MHPRGVEREAIHVDDVDVRLLAHGELAAVGKADVARRLPRLHADEVLEGDAVVVAVASPMGHQEGRKARVADRADVGAPVAEPGHREGMGEHRVEVVEVVLDVVEEREVEERLSVLFQQRVVDGLESAPTGLHRLGRETLSRRRLVVGILPEPEEAHRHQIDLREELVGHGRHGASVARDGLALLLQHLRLELGISHRRDALGEGQVADRLVGREADERVEGRVEAQHHADRARRHLQAHGNAAVVGALGLFDDLPPLLRRRVALHQRDREVVPPGGGRHLLEERPLALELLVAHRHVEVAHRGENTVGQAPESLTERDELPLLRLRRGRRASVGEAVVVRAPRGKAHRARFERLAKEPLHLRDVLVSGGRIVDGALAHHVHPQRVVGHLRGEVDGVGQLRDRIHVLGEGLPLPGQAFGEGRAGDVLHPFHERDQRVVIGGPHRREAHAAGAHDRGGHAVIRRRRHLLVPGDLPVVVGVDVGEARRHHSPRRVDRALRRPLRVAHGDDATVLDADVTRVAGRPRSVDQHTAFDLQVVLGHLSSLPPGRLAGPTGDRYSHLNRSVKPIG